MDVSKHGCIFAMSDVAIRVERGQVPQAKESASRTYWLCQLLGWSLYALIMLSFELFYRPQSSSITNVLMTDGVVLIFSITLGLFITHQWRTFMRRNAWIERSGGLPLLRLSFGILVLAVVQLGLVFVVYHFVRPLNSKDLEDWVQNGLPGTALGWICIYLVWTILYVATVSRKYAQRIELEKLQLELHMKEAELRALQAQVNPHFFFNSLNSIRALVYLDANDAADAIDRLASMMRYTLQSGRFDTVPLAEEMHSVRNYLAIEKIRFEDRLQFSESIDSDLEGMAFPPMALQTLVENAVKYGVELSSNPCELCISAKREDDQMHLTVSNQGKLQEVAGSTKVGVRNTSKRLALLFGAEAGVDLFERDGWVTARLVMPCKKMVVACA
jgi:hypothetical protein